MSDQARFRSLCRGSRVNHPCILVCRPSLEFWWLSGTSTTLQLGVERRRQHCAGDGDPSFVGKLPLVESRIKVIVIVFTEETLLPESDTLRECFNNVDVGALQWQSEPRDKSSRQEFASPHPSYLSFRISYCNLCAFTFIE